MIILQYYKTIISNKINQIKINYIDPITPGELYTAADFYNYKLKLKEFFFKTEQK